MELKSRSEASNSYFKNEAIRRYELWMQNAIRRVKRAREIGRNIRAVNIISQNGLNIYTLPGQKYRTPKIY